MLTVHPKGNIIRIIENGETIPDDLLHDIQTYVERTHEELLSGLGDKSAKEIFDWCYKTKQELEGYGRHWYWDATEEFFLSVCASSLPNYFTEHEVGDAMEKINSKLLDAYKEKKKELDKIRDELDDSATSKVKANAELSGIRTKIDQLSDELDSMKTQQNKYRQEMAKLDNELQVKKNEFHKELKQKYDEMEDKFKEEISEFKKKRDELEKEIGGLTSKSKLAKAVISVTSLFGGKER
jgi:uncharacterized coiled-coil DUF342 family protein